MKEPSHGARRPPDDSNPQPNVIWVFGDQHRAHATGYAGDPNVYTPNLDCLATEGTLFASAVAGCPWCTPFRGSLLTSCYPNRCVKRTPEQMNPDMPTIAEPFQAAGYRTAYFGKWHLDGHQESTGRAAYHHVPRERRGGFGTWIAYENNNSQYDCWVHGHEEDGAEVDLYRLPGYETDCLTDLLLDYVHRWSPAAGSNERGGGDSPREPFFAVLSVQPPHGPHVAPPAYMKRHTPGTVQLRPNVPPVEPIRRGARRRLAGYYAMIENLDHNVGRIRDVLDETGLADSTYIVFFSDHGDMQAGLARILWQEPTVGGINSHPVHRCRSRTLLRPSFRSYRRSHQPRGYRSDNARALRHRSSRLDERLRLLAPLPSWPHRFVIRTGVCFPSASGSQAPRPRPHVARYRDPLRLEVHLCGRSAASFIQPE